MSGLEQYFLTKTSFDKQHQNHGVWSVFGHREVTAEWKAEPGACIPELASLPQQQLAEDSRGPHALLLGLAGMESPGLLLLLVLQLPYLLPSVASASCKCQLQMPATIPGFCGYPGGVGGGGVCL